MHIRELFLTESLTTTEFCTVHYPDAMSGSSSSEGEIDITITPSETLKGLRKGARRRFTQERNRIMQHIDRGGDTDTLLERRNTFLGLFNDCQSTQAKYLQKLEAEGQPAADVDWLQKVDDERAATIEGIKAYIESKDKEAEEAANNRETNQDNGPVMDRDTANAADGRNEHSQPDDPMGTPRFNSTSNRHHVQEGEEDASHQPRNSAMAGTRRNIEREIQASRDKARQAEQYLKMARQEETDLVARLADLQSPSRANRKRPAAAVESPVNTASHLVSANSIDGWIFETFNQPDIQAEYSALILLSALPKANMPLFDGDPKQWPMFIQTFKSMVHDVTPFDAQRIGQLRAMLKPELQETFAHILGNPLTYQKALQELWSNYGRPQFVVQAYIKDLRKIPVLRDDDPSALSHFHQRIHGTVATLQAAGYAHELTSSVALADLVEKLPNSLSGRWGHHVYKQFQSNPGRNPDLVTFDNWLAGIVMAQKYAPPKLEAKASTSRSSFFGTRASQPKQSAYSTALPSVRALSTATNSSSAASIPPTKKERPAENEADRSGCFLCKDSRGHGLTMCNTFMSMSPADRLRSVRELGNCFRCLGRSHSARDCKRVDIVCTTAGCDVPHHPLLHSSDPGGRRPQDGRQNK